MIGAAALTFFVLVLVTGSGAVLLVAAGIGHIRHRARFRAQLYAQGVLPEPVIPALAWLCGPIEVSIGCASLAAMWVGARPWPICAGVLALTYLVFAGLLAVTITRRPGAPCACFGGQSPASWRAVIRNLVIAGSAALSAAGLPDGLEGAAHTLAPHREYVIAVIFGLGFVIVAGFEWFVSESAGLTKHSSSLTDY